MSFLALSVEEGVVEPGLSPECDRRQGHDYIPTPAEIAAACAEIRKEWSEEETERRRAQKRSRVQTRVVHLPDMSPRSCGYRKYLNEERE